MAEEVRNYPKPKCGMIERGKKLFQYVLEGGIRDKYFEGKKPNSPILEIYVVKSFNNDGEMSVDFLQETGPYYLSIGRHLFDREVTDKKRIRDITEKLRKKADKKQEKEYGEYLKRCNK
jgi:hypothetical protein